MSYYGVPLGTKFPPIIPRREIPPLAALRGFGQSPQEAPVDPGTPGGASIPSWSDIQQWMQQYGIQPPGTAPAAPTGPTVPVPPQSNIQSSVVAQDTQSTLFVAGALALVAVVGAVFLMKES